MSTIAIWISKAWLVVAMAAAGMGLAPVAQRNVAAPSDTAATPAPSQVSHKRLQNAWEREQRIYSRLGQFFDQADEHLPRAQALINKAKSNGKDVSSMQAALDAFAAAERQAQPIYEAGKAIESAHSGFDANGNVIDVVQAIQTVTDIRGKLLEIRQIAMAPRQALRTAIKAFREANKPAVAPTPASG